MLGLPDKVCCNDLCIRRGVGQNEAVGRSGKHVDADTAEKDAFGFRNKLVSRTDDDVGFGHAKQPECEARHALHAAQSQDPVRAANIRRVDDCRIDADIRPRRRADADMVTTGHFCRRHGHDCRSDVAVTPSRHIASRRPARDRLLARDEARRQLHREICKTVLLHFGKPAHIVMCEADVVLELLGDLCRGSIDFVTGQHDVAAEAIKRCCIIPRLGLTTRLDIVEDGLDLVTDITGICLRSTSCLLEVFDTHHSFLNFHRGNAAATAPMPGPGKPGSSR